MQRALAVKGFSMAATSTNAAYERGISNCSSDFVASEKKIRKIGQVPIPCSFSLSCKVLAG